MDGLLNWIWQGCLLTAITAIAAGRPGVCAATRYRLWWATLGLVVALPAIGAFIAPAGLIELGGRPAVPFEPHTVAGTTASSRVPAIGFVLVIWGGWIACSLFRLAVCLVGLSRVRAACRPFPPGREACLRHWIAQRATGRHATLAVSDHVHTAAMLGLSSPIIGISPVLLRALTDDELDQVVAHERAHVERRDDVGVLVQAIVRAVAGLHPAVWWIDRRLHVEREAACDDRVAGLVESPKQYAAILTKLAGLPAGTRSWSMAPGAARHSLGTRVVRLLDPRRSRSARGSTSAFWGAAAGLALAAVGLTRVEASESVALPVPPAIGSAAMRAQIQVPRLDRPSTDSDRPANSPVPRGTTADRGRRERMPAPVMASRIESTPALVSHPHTDGPAVLVVPTAVAASPLPIPGTALVSTTPAPLATAPDGLRVAPPEFDRSPSTASRWTVAADTGARIGQGSRRAAVTTARFFARVGTSIGSSF